MPLCQHLSQWQRAIGVAQKRCANMRARIQSVLKQLAAKLDKWDIIVDHVCRMGLHVRLWFEHAATYGRECDGRLGERRQTIAHDTCGDVPSTTRYMTTNPKKYAQHARSRLTSGCREGNAASLHGPSLKSSRLPSRVGRRTAFGMKRFPVGHVETRTGINGLLCDFTFQHNGTKSGSIPFGPHWLERKWYVKRERLNTGTKQHLLHVRLGSTIGHFEPRSCIDD